MKLFKIYQISNLCSSLRVWSDVLMLEKKMKCFSLTSIVLQADYLQPKLLGILAFFNMQLLSSSAGEKEKKKMVSAHLC